MAGTARSAEPEMIPTVAMVIHVQRRRVGLGSVGLVWLRAIVFVLRFPGR
jgi:hypothetical protein